MLVSSRADRWKAGDNYSSGFQIQMGDPSLYSSENRAILDPSGRVRLGLSLTTAGSCNKAWPIRVVEKTRSDTRPHGLPVGSGTGVAAHPIAQLKQEDNTVQLSLQSTHRPHHSRTHSFHTIYDGLDNLVRVLQSDGSTQQERKFKYDSLSRLTHERMVEANPTLDAAGVKGVSDPAKWTKVYKYNTDGLITEGTDARGVKTNFTYDGLNRIQSVTYSDGTPSITYTYDQARSGYYNNGGLTRVETADGGSLRPDTPATATEFDYDQMGRAVKHRNSIGSQVYELEYAYNLAGQLVSEKYPSGRIVTKAYDAAGRLESISDQTRTYISSVSYQQQGGAVSSTSFGNGTTESNVLNDRLQMISQTLARGSEVLQKYDYGYGQIDAYGNLDTSKNNGQLGEVTSFIGSSKQWTKKLSYDSIGRLAEEKELRGDNDQQVYLSKYDFDRFGNMYRKSANNGNSLPYTQIEESDLDRTKNRIVTGTVYDDAGNVTQDQKFRTKKFFYDANGRTFKASNIDDSDVANSVYDALGVRVAEKVGGIWRYLIHDVVGNLVEEYGGASGTPGIKFVFSDRQGSTRAVTDEVGNGLTRSDYSAFGEDIAVGTGQRTAGQGFGSSTSLRQKYGSTERDDGTGLDHTWFRKNENKAGRWTSPDPDKGSMSLRDPQSFNRYSYVQGDPANFTDPSGLNLEAGGGYCIRYHYTNLTGTRSFWGPWTCYEGNSGSGGGGGAGGTQQSAKKSKKQTKQKKNPTREQILKAMQDCLSLFAKKGEKWAIDNVLFSNSPPGGGTNSGWVDVSVKANGVTTPARVNNDVSSYSAVELAGYLNQVSNRNMAWLAGVSLWGFQDKKGNTFSAYTNYTANDLANYPNLNMGTKLVDLVGRYAGVQIHELGVSMSKITGIYPKAKGTYADTDSGMAYEECVYNKLK